MKQSIALIGPGRVGRVISKRLHLAGYPITAVISRNRYRAEKACSYINCNPDVASDQLTKAATAQIILLAVPDDHIQELALQFQGSCPMSKHTTLIHFSGLHTAEIMRLETSPAMLLSLHPLLPFADQQKAFERLHQCPCTIESNSSQTLALAEELVTAIGGYSFTLAAQKKPLYHAAASIASNYLVTLLASARDLLVNCGIQPEKAIPILIPLVQASLENVKDLGPEQGLSGPIVRGDRGTVLKHIQALKDKAPELLQLYLQLGKLTTSISQESGRLDPKIAAEINEIFSKQIKELLNFCSSSVLSEKNN